MIITNPKIIVTILSEDLIVLNPLGGENEKN